ncbi:MAG TPA: UDP-N-acetylglucosamine--N-acetylmuramyl-(pentapeptide) pyrophosphoryl-undecaprenol N-acetylglucosamine transferase [Candidatus Limnocylindria bacterium]|nr:UDP-N-acetylglucosamine--N-acetylmuramyl-(pentapeptide) pyrophosphoryl-undecaprenol N-acetylglucosamine transferase [Candidatus Limnocylindria bacterium]
MKILLVGGGSGGPVSPLIAVASDIKSNHPKAEFLLVGTAKGPEKEMAAEARIPFTSITAGKFRRYFSFRNFLAPFEFLLGFYQSFKILKEFKPDCIFGAGSFVQVPVIWAGWFLKIPSVIHQQDVVPGLANKLCQLAAKKITVTFPQTLKTFSGTLGIFYKKREGDKIVLTGNPFRRELKKGSKENAIKEFQLNQSFPTLLVMGGGTGAEFLNNLVLSSLPELSKVVQVIHSTGKGKLLKEHFENYHGYEFINNMADAYAAADIVVCRAGLSTLTELSNLDKLAIIVPMPESHQEINGMLFVQTNSAIVLKQGKLKASNFVPLIRKLLFAHEAQEELKNNISKIMPRGSTEKISEIITKIAVE